MGQRSKEKLRTAAIAGDVVCCQRVSIAGFELNLVDGEFADTDLRAWQVGHDGDPPPQPAARRTRLGSPWRVP